MLRHVQQQLANADAWASSFISEDGRSLPTRYMFIKTKQYADDFMNGIDTRWVIVPGLRGVGKSTLLAQQFRYVRDTYGDRANMLYLSAHDVVNVLKGSLRVALEQYEAILGGSFERLQKPTFLFLDEVQEDEQWAEVLFSLHGRSRQLFIFCTGSSATHLKINSDIVRRAKVEPLYPLSYTEYQMLRFDITPEVGLKRALKEAVFLSGSAEEAHRKVSKLLPAVRKYRSKIDASTFTHFMYTGSLPFLVNETNQMQVYNSITSLVGRIIYEDMAKVYGFDTATLDTVEPLIYMLADADVISRKKLGDTLDTDPRSIGSLQRALVQTEMLIEVPAKGSARVAISQPRKYLFMSPAIRNTYYYIAGIEATENTRKGRLLEDLVGLYMYREFVQKRLADLTYNLGSGQSDFTLQTRKGTCMAIEVGLGSKTGRQVKATMQESRCDYGVVISATSFGVDKANNILFLPLSIFYFM